jgi:hypothetical protein
MNSDTAPHQDILKQPTPDPGPLLAQQSASTSTHQTMSRRANLTKEGSAVLKGNKDIVFCYMFSCVHF